MFEKDEKTLVKAIGIILVFVEGTEKVPFGVMVV